MVADTRWIDFVYTRAFERSIEGVLDDHSMRRIELDLVRDPKVGVVERGTGGVRKIRIALPGTGKRGGLRLLYVLDEPEQRIYFLLAWPKGVEGVAELEGAAANREVGQRAEELRWMK